MTGEEALVLDTDVLSALCRGEPSITERATQYLSVHGRLTITSVTVFERLRGYRLSLHQGKPYEPHLQAFEALAAKCLVLPLDAEAADRAAAIWGRLSRRHRNKLGDILIAGIAVSRQIPVVTRNLRDYEPMARATDGELELRSWGRGRVRRR